MKKIFGIFFAPLRWALRTVVLVATLGVVGYFVLPHLIPNLRLPSLEDLAPSMRSYDEMAEEALAANPVMVLQEAIPVDSTIKAADVKIRRVYGYEVVREDTSGSWWSDLVGNDYAATDYVEVREFFAEAELSVSTTGFRVDGQDGTVVVYFPSAEITRLTLLSEGGPLVQHGKNTNIPQHQQNPALRQAEFAALREIARELPALEGDLAIRQAVIQGLESALVPLWRAALTSALGPQEASALTIRVQVDRIDLAPTSTTRWSPAEPPTDPGIKMEVKFAHRANQLPHIEIPDRVQRLIEVPLQVIE